MGDSFILVRNGEIISASVYKSDLEEEVSLVINLAEDLSTAPYFIYRLVSSHEREITVREIRYD